MQGLFEFDRLAEVVDIGANPIDGDPPYKGMLVAGHCRVTGFEPQTEGLERLLALAGPNERYFPDIVADGKKHTLRLCRWSGMSGLFEPDHAHLALFEELRGNAVVMERKPGLKTRRLDDIDQIERIDFLKTDAQGSELMILQNGREKLKSAVAVQVEVAFLTIYEKQPTIGDIDAELRAQGFMPFYVAPVKNHFMTIAVEGLQATRPTRQLVDADIIYVRDYTHPDRLSEDQLRQLFRLMHFVFASPDVALRCVQELVRRKAAPADSVEVFLRPVREAAAQP